MFAPLRFVLLAAMAVVAQGTAEDYARAESFGRRIAAAAATSEVRVAPHWLSGSAFWYRKDIPGTKSEFVYVDAAKGEKRPAFDHAKLATALQVQGLATGNKTALPFTWIDLAQNGSVVRFRAGNKVWQYSSGGSLAPWNGEINEATLQPLPVDIPSTSGDQRSSITFINRGTAILSLLWIDTDLEPVSYGVIAPGEIKTISTYVGHVWRLADPAGKKIATFRATADDAQAIIQDNMPPPKIPAEWASLLGLGSNKVALAEDSQNQNLTKRQFGFPRARSGRVFVKNYNVWFRDGASETQITKDGAKDNAYSLLNVYASPDEKFAAVWQVKPAQEHLVTLVESSPKQQVQPKVKTISYLKPGDRVQVDRPKLFDLDAKTEVPTDPSLFQNPYEVENMGWSRDGSEYRFLYNERGHKSLRIIGVNRQGVVRTLIEETFPTFVDYSSKTWRRAIEGTDEFLWASERDGWNHLYLFDLKKGELINQITKGQWVMRSVESVDVKARQILFKGFGMVPGQDPYYAHLARINFDGTGLQILTEGDGTHSWKWSPDKQYFTDTWSRVDMAPKSVLRNSLTGKAVTELEEGNLAALKEVGWAAPERFEALGRDGQTPIYGIIIKPSNFDPAKKYPIIEQIYAGPQDFFCPKAFATLSRQHELAELGFILVQMDGMGTNWRSKAFHDNCHKNLKDAGFPDRIAWMKAAAQTRPWMDISRVGVYGGSAGGQNAMAAVLFHGDFYKAAAADSGCHDNRMDKIWWNEAWMGWPVDKSYEDSSNVVHAGKLTGALMLLVGELDTNVDPSSTLQVANALNKAMKDYDLVFFPGANHGIGTGSPYGSRRQKDFFVKHLHGTEPPKRNGAMPLPRVTGWSVDTNTTMLETEEFQTPVWATKLSTSRDVSTQTMDLVDAIENQANEVQPNWQAPLGQRRLRH